MKNLRILLSLLSIIPAVAGSQPPARQPPTQEQMADLQRRWQSHVRAFRGAEAPEQIPYGVVMRATIRRLAAEQRGNEQAFAQALRTKFAGSDADIQRISQLVSADDTFLAAAYNEESRGYDDACTEFLKSDVLPQDALAVARRFEQIESARVTAIEKHYRDFIDALSPPARTALLTYAESTVRPNVSWSMIDSVGLATDLPEAFLSHRRNSCEAWMKRSPSQKEWKTQHEGMTPRE